MTSSRTAPVRVVLRDFPIDVLLVARRHGDALMREFAFISEGGDLESQVPRRLVEVVDALRSRYGTVVAAADEQIDAAVERDETSIDLVVMVPPEAAPAVAEVIALLDEADDFCRDGELLSLAAPSSVRELRAWYLGEVVRQIAGESPIPWKEWPPQDT